MAKPKPKFYFEPWRAEISPRVRSAANCGDRRPEGADEDAWQRVLDARKRAEDQADWLVWGSKMGPISVATSLEGVNTVMSDERIIVEVKPFVRPEKSATQEEIARRIATCVNACAGIATPETFVAEVRRLLLEFVRGESDSRDDRVLQLLARCIPPEELAKFPNDDHD